MAIEDVKTPTAFLVNENWEVIQGGKDLKAFIEGFAKRIKDYKGPAIHVQSVLNDEYVANFAKEKLIKNSK